MADLMETQTEIEIVRLLLHDLVIAKNGNMIDPEVAALSVRLDKLIVAYQRAKQLDKDAAC